MPTDEAKLPSYGATESKEEPKPPSYAAAESKEEFTDTGRLLREKLKPRWRTKEDQAQYENNIKDFLDALLSNTSLLAISNIVKRNHPVLKTLWSIAFAVCLILSIRQLYSLSNTFFSEPKSTMIQLSYKPFTYPLVTVCNHNPLRMSSVKAIGDEKLRNFFRNLENKNYSIFDNGTQLMTQRRDWERFHQLISNHTNDQRELMGYQLADFVLQCSFGGKKCQNNSFTQSLSKTYGNCFTFNAGSDIVAKNGREHGLIMTLYLELDEYLKNFIPSSGVKVHIHEPNSMPAPENAGFSVPPGFQTSIGVSLRKIDRLNRPVGRCSEDSVRFQQQYGYRYTYSACKMLCKHRQVARRCKCYDQANAKFYDIKNLEACRSQEQLSCLIQTEYQAEQGALTCNCLLPCQESHYSFKQSLSEWPADSYEKRLFGDLVDVKPKIAELRNETKNLARRNLLNLIVYVDGVMTEHIIEKSSYLLDSFLSDIGGTLGLFLGFSVLTGFELLEASALILAYFGGKVIYSPEEEERTSVLSRSGSQQIMTLHSTRSE